MIIDFENFINEFNTMYSFDGSNIKLGSSVLCTDGTSGIIISKKSNEGLVSYKDHKGNTYVANPEELMITKNLKLLMKRTMNFQNVAGTIEIQNFRMLMKKWFWKADMPPILKNL